MDFSYPKNEKLKGQKTIDRLFSEGKTVAQFPLRLVYVATRFDDGVPLKMGVSVSKKHFKKAADRNYYKRILRECYRHNKPLLGLGEEKSFAVMFFYQTAERLDYSQINALTAQLFEKFAKAVGKERTS